ncbi:MAG: DNA/RNA non-specific endonuclease [Bacteroides sp.]
MVRHRRAKPRKLGCLILILLLIISVLALWLAGVFAPRFPSPLILGPSQPVPVGALTVKSPESRPGSATDFQAGGGEAAGQVAEDTKGLLDNPDTEVGRSVNSTRRQAYSNPRFLEEPVALDTSALVRIYHRAYTVAFQTRWHQPRWVAYQLTRSEVGGGEPRRKFTPDPAIASMTALDAYYKNSGFDRGHLAPAADMAFDNEAMKQSFYFSNVSPQVPSFNRGIWKQLEERVRAWAARYDSLYIATGPLFLREDTAYVKGYLPVPTHFYKALLVHSQGRWQAVAFCLPQSATGSESYWLYSLTVDSLQSVSGLDFFSLLPDELEYPAEHRVDLQFWHQK